MNEKTEKEDPCVVGLMPRCTTCPWQTRCALVSAAINLADEMLRMAKTRKV